MITLKAFSRLLHYYDIRHIINNNRYQLTMKHVTATYLPVFFQDGKIRIRGEEYALR